MTKPYKIFSLLGLSVLFSLSAIAQNNFFTDAGANKTTTTNGKRLITPTKFRTATLDVASMRNFLWSLQDEKKFISIQNRAAAPTLSLPMPDGTVARFKVWESSIQEPTLQAKFAEIKTFAGQGIDDPYASIRLDFNPYFGFSAQILSPSGRIYIDPYARKDIDTYISYYHSDNDRESNFNCLVKKINPQLSKENVAARAGPCRGTQLTTYRLAITCTGEYAQTVSGGVADPGSTHAAIVTTINRVTQVYETELSIRLVLIGANNSVEFMNPASDPFTNDGDTDLDKITNVINGAVGAANYDVGHLFCTNSTGGVGAGVAGLGVVCTSNKGSGLTGRDNPTGDGYDIDYVSHEMGHQFGAEHTYNSNTCASAGGAYEPGGGTTIMAYAGICSSTENIQPNSDPYFHATSFDDISSFLAGGSGGNCGTNSGTGNNLPVITSMPNNGISIPIQTPFTLTATATDMDGDPITYSWESWDKGPAGTWPSAASTTNRPLFRSRVPNTTGSRTFPDIRVIVANYPGTSAPSQMNGLRGEVLPSIARPMKFRLTVRDNRAGGGGVVSGGSGCQLSSVFQVNAVGTTPFTVTTPNGGESYVGGSTQTILWNNAATDAAPFNVTNVKISLSTDGGLSYPIVISASTPNDGSEALTIPANASTTARIKIEAIQNIFFDISNANFTITAPSGGFEFGPTSPATANCPAPATMSITLPTISNGGFNTPIQLSATAGVPAGTSISFGTNPVVPGNSSAVVLNNASSLAPGTYTVTVQGSASGATTKTAMLSYVINQSNGPAITAQPPNRSICLGGNISFSIQSSSASSFQWQENTGSGFTDITNTAPYSGAATNTLTITNATADLNQNQYRCVATNACGTTTSNAGTLTVNDAPAITTDPQSQSVCEGSGVSFSTTATGSGLSYQWQESPDGVAFTNISGATSSTFSIVNTTAAQHNFRYRCVVSGACTPAATSAAATLTVSAAVTITNSPASQTVCQGSNASFSVTAGGTNLSYKWELSTNGGTTWTTVANGGVYSGATTATLSLTNIPAAFNSNRYRAVVSNANCTPGVSAVATLTVSAAVSITNSPASQTVCQGSNASFSVTAGGTNLSYKWELSTNGGTTWTTVANGGVYSGATTATLSLTNIPAAFNSNQYRAVVSNANCTPGVSAVATLTVSAAVTITNSPASQTVCQGSNASFSITAGGTNLSYKWELSTNGGTTWTTVANGGVYSGATTATLSLTNIPAAFNSNRYRAVVSNANCTPGVSAVATLTVSAAVSITNSPASQTVCQGSNASFSVTAGGTNLSYKWELSTNGGTTWTTVANGGVYSGATTATLSLTNIPAAFNSNQYRAVVSNANCTPGVSAAATLTVSAAVTITNSPASQTVCQGSNASFSVTAGGTNLSYKWELSTNGGTTWTTVANGGVYSGATTATLSLTNIPAAFNSNQYRAVVSNANCTPGVSAAATLTVSAAVSITNSPASQTVCQGSNASFSVTAGGTNLSYKWELSTNGGTTWTTVANGGVYSGATTATLSLTNIPAAFNSNQYRAVVSNANCTPGVSAVATLTVSAAVTITNSPASQTVCQGSNASFSVTAGGTNLSYKWELSTNGGTTWTTVANGGVYSGATTATLSLTNIPAAFNSNRYRAVVSNANCTPGVSAVATLTVSAAVSITNSPASQTVCQGSNASFSVTAGGTNLSYKWELSTNGGTTWTTVANGGVYSGATTATLSLTNIPAAFNSNQYRAVVSNANCTPGVSAVATLTVSAAVTITNSPASQTVCQGSNASFSVTAGGTNLSYKWELSTNGGTTWTTVANGGVYSGATTATLSLTNIPAAFNSNQYRAVVSNANCTPGVSAAATLTVNNSTAITTHPQNQSVCAGSNASFSTTATGSGISYQWQLSTNNGSTWTNISGATSTSYSRTAVAINQNGYQFRVIVTGTCGSITSNAATMRVNPSPVISFSPMPKACISDRSVKLTGTPIGGTFSGQGVSGDLFNPAIAGVGTQAISYTVTQQGCTNSVTATIQVSTCEERNIDMGTYPAVVAYPIPNEGEFSIRLNTIRYDKIRIRVFNILGQLVKLQEATGLTYGSVIPVRLNHLPSGVYMLHTSNYIDKKASTISMLIVR